MITEGKILAAAGTTASILSMTGGWLTYRYPVLGPTLIGTAGFVMLVGNITVLCWPKPGDVIEEPITLSHEDLP